MSKKYEDFGYVLDFLPEGHTDEQKPAQYREPVAQILGGQYLTLLEVVPREDISLSPQEKVYIGKKGRDKIERVKKRIDYEDLTSAAKAEVPVVIEKIIEENEEEYVEFFNEASPITNRYHQFELIPGIGKKLMWSIIETRRAKKFESFEDLKERVKSLPNPTKILAERIEDELKGECKYSIFTRETKKDQEDERSRR